MTSYMKPSSRSVPAQLRLSPRPQVTGPIYQKNRTKQNTNKKANLHKALEVDRPMSFNSCSQHQAEHQKAI